MRYRYQLAIPACVVFVFYVASTIDRPHQFSYAGNNCVERSTILPGLFTSKNSAYQVQFRDDLSVLGTTLIAGSMCVEPARVPRGNSSEAARTSLFGVPLLFQRGVLVTTGAAPTVNQSILTSAISVSRPLVLPTSAMDSTFDYKLYANDKVTDCKSSGRSQICNIASLDLRQAAKYTFELQRYFRGDKVETVFSKAVTTLSPVSITESSVKAGDIVYTRPTSIEFKTDKAIEKATVTLQKRDGDTLTTIDTKTTISGQTISIAFTELARSSQYQLTVSEVEATDGSTLLDKTHVLSFSMSGGPRVTGVSVGKYGVSAGATVVVTFDQPLSPTQDLTPFIKLAGGISGIVRQGNQLRFSTSGVPICGDFSITVSKGIQSEHGVVGDVAWSFSSRMLCHSVISIGGSVKGRSITAYRFGNGPQTILYLGATHGNEVGTYQLLSQWIDELESKARSIPADKTVIVIPALNRDGIASGSRRNANNVDLNRNFPTTDWKADVTMPGGEMVQGGGGSTSLSEPESRAIASYTVGLSPRLVLTYHSQGSLVTPNEAGVSSSYASTYSIISGYYVSSKASASETFEYDTTGAYEDWLYEKPGIAAILVELGSHTSPSASRNFPAMWAMLK
jgi:protein MpaA